ncbi:MAG: NUDIX domain-containing protein [Alphaproteobacteria bacterium]|nr:NUDIX domain-containing protein [Alphaproteobacteria bacterium]
MTSELEILDRTRLAAGFLKVDRFTLRHRLHAGGMSAPLSREVLRRGPAAAVLLYDPAHDAVTLVEQFRIGPHIAGLPAWVLEVVAGLVEPGESPIDVARREAREEAGAEISAIAPLLRFTASPGCSDETIDLFIARVDSTALSGIHGLADEGEDIRVVVMPRAEAYAACGDGRIANAITLVAIQWLELNRDRLPALWS